MTRPHFQFWPRRLPHNIRSPQTSLWYNLEVSARRYPDKDAVIFYGRHTTFHELHDDAVAVAGWLQQVAGVQKGDRVLLYMQNCPQFMAAYYGILRADAAVAPVNPMNRPEEFKHYVTDSGAATVICSADLAVNVTTANAELPEAQRTRHLLVTSYADALPATYEYPEDAPPAWITAQHPAQPGAVAWNDVLAQRLVPGPHTAGPDDLAVMPYTSGTTGFPKGCMHPHRTVMHNIVGGSMWSNGTKEGVSLSIIPLFHVTGMQYGMNAPIYMGSTVVMLPRWDREVAGRLISRYKITHWTNVHTMVIDFLASPQLAEFDLSSLAYIGGGGAAMPQAVAERLLKDFNLAYLEVYGLAETIAPTHSNPADRAKQQCLGIPVFNTDARIVDPQTLKELPPGEVGEIIVSGPQVFLGYWGKPQATAEVFIEFEGKKFFRTGDLGRMDEDGYFFLTDRLKRMINASGFKVWPAEVESLLYKHPDVQEACIIGTRDAYRGESVKAVVVLKAHAKGKTTEDDIINWARDNMAAYKYPRVVEFVDALPKSGTGKVMWRTLQEQENARNEAAEKPAAA